MELSCANKVTNDINSESSDGSSGVKAALVGEIQLGEKLIQSLSRQVSSSLHITVAFHYEARQTVVGFYLKAEVGAGFGSQKLGLRLTKTKNHYNGHNGRSCHE